MKWLILAALCWLIGAAFSYAISFAYFQRSFSLLSQQNLRRDAGSALLFGLVFGPFGMVLAFFLSGFAEHGLKWRIRLDPLGKRVDQ